ncbi:MAG: hypothetical protein HY554_19315, partial [Elusimicrobia bacterium]|nr:hypothetical protein [Elusimicrobiota bacterium]
REDVEYGVLPKEEIEAPPPAEEDIAFSTGAPRPARPEIEMPTYGTSLSITGRKLIGFSFNEKRFTSDQRTTGRPKSTNLVDITQQLQLRMQGKVGPKITVNVDYDDTKLNKQDISVVYQGDPNEIVQNASFGDIDLSLPATEFVSYNKQLFGIRADLKYKGFKGSFIGSRTKGQTKTKQFIGSTQFASIDILDTSYLRRQYYDVSFGTATRLPILPGSERIFVAYQDPRAVNTNSIDLTADDLAVPSSSFTAKFVQLAAGQDYTIDYVKGIVQFRIGIEPQFVLAVDYVDASGQALASQGPGATGRPKLMKTPGDVALADPAEVGYLRELKTVYSLGQLQVVRDNGRGNFVLKVLDPKRNEVGPELNPVQKYPDTLEVDFENGLFRLQQPFGISASSPTPDPELYAPVPISKRLFHVEYQFRLRTFFLEPNLVIQSEIVLIDGVKLTRNVDYFIDYESGFITFFNDNRIGATSIVDISYEVAPFTGSTAESILGMRVSHDFNSHFSLGSTLLYQAGSKPSTVPSITDLAKSLLIYEVDSQLKDITFFRWLKGTFQGEYARSHQNPNLSKFALIDNMEGAKQEDSAPTFINSWQLAANPTQGSVDPRAVSFINEDIPVLAINPKAQASASENVKVLNVNYDFAASVSTEVSIVHVFSPTGLDFSQKQVLEVIMHGDNSGNELNFTLGGINEDGDGDGVLDTEDSGKDGIPGNFDFGENDGILQPEEDLGYLHNPAGKASSRIGAGNGRIDSEDLNQNQRLDAGDFTGDNYGYNFAPAQPSHAGLFDTTTNSTRTVVDFTGWHAFQIPLDVSTATFNRWTAIKELRISIRKRAGSALDAGTLKFARLAAVGTSWQRGQAGDPATGAGAKATESLAVTAVNNVDNPQYTPIFSVGGEPAGTFDDLYGSVGGLQQQSNSRNLSEQAIQLLWTDLPGGATVHTRRTFPRSINIAQHKRFNFLIYGNADSNNVDTSGDNVFFLRAGNDRDYFEVRVPLNFIGWRRVAVAQIDVNGDQIPDRWGFGSGPENVVIFSTGSPNLQQIGAFVAGVYRAGGATVNRGAVFLNELYMSDAIQRVGTAQKLQADFNVLGWGTLGGKYRSVDRHYQTPTTVVTNQDNRQDSAYANLTRIAWLPMNFTLNRTVTDTPSTAQTGDLSNLVNLLQQGKVTTWNGTANGNFTYGTLPRLGFGHVRARTEYDLLTRLDDRKTYNTTFDYGVPIQSRFLPSSIGLNYSFAKYSVSFTRPDVLRLPGNFNTDELTNTYGARLAFTPWTGSSFNPTASLTEVKENRSDFSSGKEVKLRYPKSVNQNVGFSSNFRLLSWLIPSVNYNISNIENNVLTPSTFVVTGSTYVFGVGDLKTVNRNATGSINLNLSVADLWKRTKLFKSLRFNNGYQLADGDVWNNVEKELSTTGALWVRSGLKARSPVAVRQTLTLRDTYSSNQQWAPLESYQIGGRKAAFKTLSLTNNYVHSIQRNETTNTPSKTISTTLPDLVASMSQIERLLWADRWMQNGQVNLRYKFLTTTAVNTSRDTENALGTELRAMIRKNYNTSLSVNFRETEKSDLRLGVVTNRTRHRDATVQTQFVVAKVLQMTPKVDYVADVTELGTGVKQQDVTVITPALQARADLARPRGLVLPFTGKTILFTNRVIWSHNLSMALRSSPVTQADNSKLLNYTTSGDYEIAKNLRMTLNGGFSRLWHKFLKEENFISYNFGTTLTFQF